MGSSQVRRPAHDQQTLGLAFPLKGSQLIEASAGTGKTHISALYLRLVLGHGGDDSVSAENYCRRKILS